MPYEERVLTADKVERLLNSDEGHFFDLKSKDITPAKLSRTVSAFANTAGGDIYVGIKELDKKQKIREWEGFENIEETNAYIDVISNLSPLDNFLEISFLEHYDLHTFVLKISVDKTIGIIKTTDGEVYIRRGAQNLHLNTEEKRRRLEYDKGIVQFETEKVNAAKTEELVESDVLLRFSDYAIPAVVSRQKWLEKQHLLADGIPTVAGLMLFSDEPQASLPKRSAIKIFRYKTSGCADRDMLDGVPQTIEGCAYNQIYSAVEQTKRIVDSMKKLGHGLENVSYPTEALHEIITNAVIHRDYSIQTDIQIRIFDNRIEVESPGVLPGHITVSNILDEQFSRNPRIVRLINKFENPPNKDVGEGLNTAFDAMEKLRLKSPEIIQNDNSVLVIIKHERLASPEVMVMEYLKDHKLITNAQGRKLTGIKSENIMKNVFIKLREQGMLRLRGQVWEKIECAELEPEPEQLDLFK